MRIVEYSLEYTDHLKRSLDIAYSESPDLAFRARLLRSDSFVRHYFLGHPDCCLYLLLDNDDEILATLGSETIYLRIGTQRYRAAILSNTYSLKGGALSFLFTRWMREVEIGVTFPGNPLMDRIISRQKRWQRVHGLRTYFLNWNYPTEDHDPKWKKFAKPKMRILSRINMDRMVHRVERFAGRDLEVTEVPYVDNDMAQRQGSYGFKLDTDVNHLNWRFSTSLSHAKYRVFRVINGGITRGYVILAEWPHRIVVSHCDGDDPVELACAVILAVSKLNNGQTRYRQVILACTHSAMIGIYQRFGFRPKTTDMPFYLGFFRNEQVMLGESDDWLVNLDLGDAGTILGMVYTK